MNQVISKSEKDTKQIASKLAERIKSTNLKIISLKGDLGAGKTVFVKGFCEKYGVQEFRVKSPTYTYMRKYAFDEGNIYHFDYYRLNKAEANVLEELQEIIDDKSAILLIEWPDSVNTALPLDIIEVVFNMTEKLNERLITINLPK